MQILHCAIAGIPHRKPTTLPAVGTILTIVPEPSNPFDSFALKVMYGDSHLGYIPKSETATCRIANITQVRVTEVVPARKWTEVMIESMESHDQKHKPEYYDKAVGDQENAFETFHGEL